MFADEYIIADCRKMSRDEIEIFTNEYTFNAKMYSIVNKERFSFWLVEQLRKRDMTQADLARASGITRGGISNLINQVRNPDPETCLAISRALNLPPEIVFRAAGLLPPAPSDTEYAEELLYYFSQLPPEERKRYLDLLRFEVERQEKEKGKAKRSREKPPAQMLLKER